MISQKICSLNFDQDTSASSFISRNKGKVYNLEIVSTLQIQSTDF